MLRVAFFVMSLSLSLVSFSQELPKVQPDAPVKADQTILDKLGLWGVSADLRLLGLDLFDDSYVRAGYRYNVEPSFSEGLFSRLDRYYFETNVKAVHEISEASDDEFGIGLSANNRVEVDFIRHYEDSSEALKAIPYFAKNLPLTTERALNNLNPSDLVLMKTRLALMVKGSFFHEMGYSHLGVDVSAWYLIAGEFQVHVMRLNDGHVRLKFIGIRNKEKGFEAKLTFLNELKIFKVRRVDEKVTELLDLDPIVWRLTSSQNSLFLADYVLKLSEARTAEAYDHVLKRSMRFKNANLIDPRKSVEEVRDALVMDLSKLEDIANEDKDRTDRRVTRTFKGSAHSKMKGSELKLGLSFLQSKTKKKNSENRIISIGENNLMSYYFLQSYETATDTKIGFSYLRLRKETDLNALYASDAGFRTRNLENLIFNTERFDKKFKNNELRAVKALLRQAIPKHIYRQIPFSRWNLDRESVLDNVGVRYQVTLLPTFFSQLPNLGHREIAQAYIRFLENTPLDGLAIDRKGSSINLGTGSDLERHFGNEVNRVARKLKVVFDTRKSVLEKTNAIMSLRKNQLFRRTGTGFLSSFLDEEILANFLRFEISLESSETETVGFEYGNFLQSPVYRRILYIQAILNKDVFDIRLEAEGYRLSEIRRGRP
jgi:hypothetical protein